MKHIFLNWKMDHAMHVTTFLLNCVTNMLFCLRLQSRFSSHRSLLRKLDETSDSREFLYRILIRFKNNGNERKVTLS